MLRIGEGDSSCAEEEKKRNHLAVISRKCKRIHVIKRVSNRFSREIATN
jgi:hypothetical protein